MKSRADHRAQRHLQERRAAWYVFSVAAGILPAVEPGILPGGKGVWFEKSLPLRTSGPGGKMPPSTAAKMAAATDVNPTLNAYDACPTLNRSGLSLVLGFAGDVSSENTSVTAESRAATAENNPPWPA